MGPRAYWDGGSQLFHTVVGRLQGRNCRRASRRPGSACLPPCRTTPALPLLLTPCLRKRLPLTAPYAQVFALLGQRTSGMCSADPAFPKLDKGEQPLGCEQRPWTGDLHGELGWLQRAIRAVDRTCSSPGSVRSEDT